jgi:hypothetical protein
MKLASKLTYGYLQMPSGSFTQLAPPLLFGPWVNAIEGLGFRASVRIDIEPQGSTVIFGEVRFADQSMEQTVVAFQGSVLFETCDCLQNIELRLKGVPLGSAVDGTWQANPHGSPSAEVTPNAL